MKKYLLIIAVMMAFIPSSAFAQLRSQSVIESKTETIGFGMHSYMLQTGEYYSLYMRSTNEFDEMDTLTLGIGVKSALTTMMDLINLFNRMHPGEKVSVEDVSGKKIYLWKATKHLFEVDFEYQAGRRYLTKKEMQNYIKILAQRYKDEMTATPEE